MNGRVLGLTLAIALPAHGKRPAMTPDHGKHLMTHLQGTGRCDSSPCKEGRYRHVHMPHVQKRQDVGQLMDRAHNSIKPAILPSQLGSAFLSSITAISSVSLFPSRHHHTRSHILNKMRFSSIVLGLAAAVSAIDIRGHDQDICRGGYVACVNIDPNVCCTFDGKASIWVAAVRDVPSLLNPSPLLQFPIYEKKTRPKKKKKKKT